jgi:four helix bundle protein
MFLQLNHQKLDVFALAKAVTTHSYRLTQSLPFYEKGNLVQQIRRASLSVLLNIAEGSSKRSASDRARFYEIARASLVEVDAALDICEALGFINKASFSELGAAMNSCFALLSNLIVKTKSMS